MPITQQILDRLASYRSAVRDTSKCFSTPSPGEGVDAQYHKDVIDSITTLDGVSNMVSLALADSVIDVSSAPLPPTEGFSAEDAGYMYLVTHSFFYFRADDDAPSSLEFTYDLNITTCNNSGVPFTQTISAIPVTMTQRDIFHVDSTALAYRYTGGVGDGFEIEIKTSDGSVGDFVRLKTIGCKIPIG